MKTITILALAAASTCTACATKGVDPLCAPLRGFVSSVEPKQSRELALHTRFGSNFNNEPNEAIAAKYCEHKGYAPAQSVCAVFMEHAAIEFAEINLTRALTCLAPDAHFGGLRVGSGTFSLYYGDDDRASAVSIEYRPDPVMGGMVLRVAAKGY